MSLKDCEPSLAQLVYLALPFLFAIALDRFTLRHRQALAERAFACHRRLEKLERTHCKTAGRFGVAFEPVTIPALRLCLGAWPLLRIGLGKEKLDQLGKPGAESRLMVGANCGLIVHR
jgi:hypothetical protein